jgi:hypothetical protein
MMSMADSSFNDIGEQGHGRRQRVSMAMDECVLVEEIYCDEEIIPNKPP